MFDDENNVPRLRFPGYSDAWEKRKLGDVAEIIGGGTPSTSETDYWNGDIDWYSPAEIGNQIYVSNSQKKITELGLQKSSAKLLPVGTILFTSRAGIGNTAIVAKEASTNQGFQSIVPKKEELNSYFIFSMTDRLKRYGEVTGAGSTFVEVSGKQMAQMVISLPGVEEQYEIGQLFQKLDNLITVNQREGQKLKDLKEAYLQKMFPRAGENVPELRFPGFTDVWEKRELGQVVNKIKSYSLSRDVERKEQTGYKYIHYGDIHKGVADIIDRNSELPDIESNKYEILQVNDLVVADASEDYLGIASPSVVKELPEENLVAGLHTIALRPENSNAIFLYYLLHTNMFKKFGYRTGTGLKVFGISWPNLSKFEFSLPNLEEQGHIVSLLESLDNLITVNQREAQKLQDLKQAYLKDMFV